jgi:transcriptional regulator with XRE-family HTH domain
MINTKLLKSYFVKNGLKQEEVAKRIGISYQSLSDKVNNKAQFKINEVSLLCDILNIAEDKDEVFFAKK